MMMTWRRASSGGWVGSGNCTLEVKIARGPLTKSYNIDCRIGPFFKSDEEKEANR
jgi:hypothetical protein